MWLIVHRFDQITSYTTQGWTICLPGCVVIDVIAVLKVDLFLRMEFKWFGAILVGSLLLTFVLMTWNFNFPNKHVPPPHRMLSFAPKEQLRKSFSGTVKLSQLKSPMNLSFTLFGGWNNVSQEKALWEPSHLTPAAFRDWVHWEPGLKFHQPCKHGKKYPCCSYGPGHKARKVHFVLNSSNLSISTLVNEFYQKTQNKKLLFVRDSIMLHIFDSVADLIMLDLFTSPQCHWNKALDRV